MGIKRHAVLLIWSFRTAFLGFSFRITFIFLFSTSSISGHSSGLSGKSLGWAEYLAETSIQYGWCTFYEQEDRTSKMCQYACTWWKKIISSLRYSVQTYWQSSASSATCCSSALTHIHSQPAVTGSLSVQCLQELTTTWLSSLNSAESSAELSSCLGLEVRKCWKQP